MYNRTLLPLVAVLHVSCSAFGPAAPPSAMDELKGGIIYVSVDLQNAMIFSEERVRTGNLAALAPDILPSYPLRDISAGDDVRCLSAGPPNNSLEFAIKRPIQSNDRFECLDTSFHVTRCFERCRAALIEIQRPVRTDGSDETTLTSYMYVDACRGVVVYSTNANLAGGIPLQALLLRGPVGILADLGRSECHSF